LARHGRVLHALRLYNPADRRIRLLSRCSWGRWGARIVSFETDSGLKSRETMTRPI
jgi:hypothetical protein